MYFISVLLITLTSCSSGPVPIELGKDMCDFCKMNIMDAKFGGEIITTKGKVLKFDGAECMLAYLRKHPATEFPVKSTLVVDYSNPGNLISAENASFLISEKIPSPMGANLSAYATRDSAEKKRVTNGGEICSWGELFQKFQ